MNPHRQRIVLLLASIGTVLAFGMPSAASAVEHKLQAGQFLANVGPAETAKIDSEQIGTNTLTLNGLSYTCTSVKGTGAFASGGSSSTSVSLSTSYETCHVVFLGLTKLVTFTMNQCSFVLNATTTTAESGTTSNPADTEVSCQNGGEAIEIHMYSTVGSETTTTCTYDLEPQGPISGVTLTNQANTPAAADDLKVSTNVSISLKNTIKSALCGQNEKETAIYSGQSTLRATRNSGAFVDLGAGFSSSEAAAGQITAGVGSKVIAGLDAEQISTSTFTTNGLSVTCGTAKLTGNALSIGPTFSEATLTPKFETCHMVIAGLTKLTTFTTNHCAFVLTSTGKEEGGGVVSYPVDAEVECEHPGEAIQIHIYSSSASEAATTCTYDIGEQGPFPAGELVNNPNTSALPNDVVANFEFNLEVQNTIEGAFCGSKATESMLFRGEDTVQATNGVGEGVETAIS